MHPSDLGLILSYKCQSHCAHCIYNCGPSWKDWMKPEDVRDALKSTLTWQHHYQVHLTGGEPFLNFPLLLKSTEIAVELGIPVYVETNAGWGLNDRQVREKLSALHDAGLQAILVSVSPFHAETISPERTITVIRIATEVFGLDRVMIYQQQWLDKTIQFGIEGTNDLQNYVAAFGPRDTGRLLWQGYGLISGGRSGYRLGHLIERQEPEVFAQENCLYELLFAPHSHFDLYGNFIPGFCGGLSLGSWRDLAAIEDSVNSGNLTDIIKILTQRGPYGLFEMASRDFGYQPLPEGYAGKCHLCVDVRRYLTEQDTFVEFQPLQFYKEI